MAVPTDDEATTAVELSIVVRSFEAFFRDEYPRAIHLAIALTGRTGVAEELTQDAFVAAYRNWARVSGLDRPDLWVRRVLVNACTSGRYAEFDRVDPHGVRRWPPMGEDDALLAGQRDYYRAHAPEYDDWFLRRGRYDHGPDVNAVWGRETQEVATALAALPLDGARVLELAPGSGAWTDRYVDRVASVTAVDTAPEMVERARVRLGERAAKVDFVMADIFTFQSAERYDVVVFCFWISHVPRARIDDFLSMIAVALAPDGRAFFVDSLPAATSGRADRPAWDRDGEVQHRVVADGRTFDVVKNHWPSEELRSRFAGADLDADIRETATYFQYGVARSAREVDA